MVCGGGEGVLSIQMRCDSDNKGICEREREKGNCVGKQDDYNVKFRKRSREAIEVYPR